MSAVHNARTRFGRKTIRKEIARSGQVKSGKLLEPPSLPQIPGAYHAVIKAECRIIPDLTYTDGPNIWIYQIPIPTAAGVIKVFIEVSSDAENVRKLERNKKVEFAIGALLQTIRNELYLKESTGNGNATDTTGSRDGGQERGRKNEV